MKLFIPFLIFAGVMSLITFIVFGIDKHYATHHKWRIRESTLFLLSILFGAPGAVAGMIVFRHKTRKPRFRILLPLLAVLQIAVIVWIGITRK